MSPFATKIESTSKDAPTSAQRLRGLPRVQL